MPVRLIHNHHVMPANVPSPQDTGSCAPEMFLTVPTSGRVRVQNSAAAGDALESIHFFLCENTAQKPSDVAGMGSLSPGLVLPGQWHGRPYAFLLWTAP